VALAAVAEPEPAPEITDPSTNGQQASKVARQQPRPQPKKQTRSQRKR